MEEALFGPAANVGPENDFPGPGFGACERMYVHEDGIVHAIKLNGLSERRVYDAWMSEQGGFMPANAIQPVELPNFGRLRAEIQGGGPE
jgi:hypothetical protein